jgi:hypothetical protein
VARSATATPSIVVRELGHVDLRGLGVVPDDPRQASHNREVIQRAIEDNSGKSMVLDLPAGSIYVDRGAHYDSIRFGGGSTTDLTLAGRGPDATHIMIEGDATSGIWLGIEIADGARRIALRDFSIEHGEIANRSPTQQDHLIQLNARTAITGDIEISNIHFGPCIGDALRIAGTAPSYVEHVKAHDFSMDTAGHKSSRGEQSRSGLSFQRGFKDVEVYNFRISGARGSPIDMEPTGSAAIDNLDIHDGVVDNSRGDTAYAVSLGGSEDPGHVVRPFANGKFHDIVILEGILNIINTSGLEVSDVTIYVSDRAPKFKEPLLYVFHENANIKFTRLNMIRDTGAPPGALVLVNHGPNTYTSNIEFDGGVWISRVDPVGKPPAYVSFFSTQGVKMHDVVLRAEGGTPGGRYGMMFRSGARDVAHVDLSGLRIESPNGKLKAGIWMAATNNHDVSDVRITNVKAENVAETGVLFDAAPGSNIDRAPVLKGNHFAGCTKEWDGVNGAVGIAPAGT